MSSASYGPAPMPEKLYTKGADFPYLFRLLHWLLWPSLVILTLTGFSQHAVASPWSLFGSPGVLPAFFWPGRVHLFHIWAALVFSPAVIAVLWIYLRTRQRYRMTHFIMLVGGLALVVSGVLLSMWPGPPEVYQAAHWVHVVVGLALVPLAFLRHALLGLTRYRRALRPAFRAWSRPQFSPVLCFIPLLILTSCLILNSLPIPAPWRDLVAKRIDPATLSDFSGDTDALDTLPWDDPDLTPVVIDLTGGLGFDRGQTRVTLWAMHDGNELFMRAVWHDPIEDRRNMPWEKTADGWRRLVTNPDDEIEFYEDKFSLVFPVEPDWQFKLFGCALQCHAGSDIRKSDRFYGYKCSPRPIDVWHWKSTRSDPTGQVDDKYWSKIDPDNKDVGRYGDPKQKGTGYAKNISEDKTRPAFLPESPTAVKQGIILREHAAPYDSDVAKKVLAGMAEGTIVPGIVASAAEGDRGDVRCKSQYVDGYWTLYIRRKLDTQHELDNGTQTDVIFKPGRAYSFACAAFDHASKRHAYEFPVYRLVLAP